MQSGKGQQLPFGPLIKTADPTIGNRHRIETGTIMHGHGHRRPVFLMALIEAAVVNGMVDIAIGHQQGFIPKLIQGKAQAASRSQHGILLLHQHAGDPLQGMDDLIAQIMTVDHNMITTGLLQTLNREQQQGVIEDGEKGFGTNEGIGQQASTEAGRQDHGLHQEKKEEKEKRKRAI